MPQPFTASLFASIQPIMDRILSHPFNTGLADGTLPRGQFLFYMQQDSLYLIDFAKALALVGSKMRAEEDISLLLHFAGEALVAERSLHNFYFREFNTPPAQEKAPACFAYTAHLLERAALGSVGQGMAALLPCFWIYREVGNHILHTATPGNPYAKWIETYSCPDYSALVDRAVALTDRLAAESSVEERRLMADAFTASSKMEYCFWDDAAALRAWPV